MVFNFFTQCHTSWFTNALDRIGRANLFNPNDSIRESDLSSRRDRTPPSHSREHQPTICRICETLWDTRTDREHQKMCEDVQHHGCGDSRVFVSQVRDTHVACCTHTHARARKHAHTYYVHSYVSRVQFITVWMLRWSWTCFSYMCMQNKMRWFASVSSACHLLNIVWHHWRFLLCSFGCVWLIV